MTPFKIIAYLTFAVLFVGKTVNFAAAEVNTSATIASASGTSSQGVIHPKTRGFAPLEGSIAGLLSMLSEESVARTHAINTTSTSTVATPSNNTSAFMSPSVTSSRTSVSVTPWSTVSFTLTFPSLPHNRSASSIVHNNSTRAATASGFSNANFTVTFTHAPPTGTGQAHSVSIISQPTQPTSAGPAAPTSSTKNGGSHGVQPVSGGLVVVIVCLGGILLSL
ncbi:hypothetical protein VMCG_02365 [Cytospora schulzeri]|uniref:Uncharacterized protein n=1 Tax=Cytospora schulzeri TaxID=448051 RepID=A0A423X164_9PEZI|nr:hypothetical protein VMCG_02365 [Valsa malicola]